MKGLIAAAAVLGALTLTAAPAFAGTATVIYPGDVITITVDWPTYYIFGVHPANPSDIFFVHGGADWGFTSQDTLVSTNSSGTQSTFQVTVPNTMNGYPGPLNDISINVDSMNPDYALGTVQGTYDFQQTPPTNQLPEVPWAAALPMLALGAGGLAFRRRRPAHTTPPA